MPAVYSPVADKCNRNGLYGKAILNNNRINSLGHFRDFGSDSAVHFLQSGYAWRSSWDMIVELEITGPHHQDSFWVRPFVFTLSFPYLLHKPFHIDDLGSVELF
jgi:hypothetical protein